MIESKVISCRTTKEVYSFFKKHRYLASKVLRDYYTKNRDKKIPQLQKLTKESYVNNSNPKIRTK